MLKKQILSICLTFFLVPTLGLAEEETPITKAEITAVVKISDAWIAEAPPTAAVLAGYLQLENTSEQDVVLSGAHCEDFKKIEIHETVLDAGKAKMVAHETLPISAGETVSLQPGGFHLMLIGAKRPLKAGDTTEITLKFQTGETQTVEMAVKQRDAEMDHHHHQH